MSVGNWAVELRQELHNIGLTCVWRNQQERDFTEITKTVKDWCNDNGGQDILAAPTTSNSELLLGWNTMYRITFEERNKWNSVVARRSVEVEIQMNMSFMFGWSGNQTYCWINKVYKFIV